MYLLLFNVRRYPETPVITRCNNGMSTTFAHGSDECPAYACGTAAASTASTLYATRGGRAGAGSTSWRATRCPRAPSTVCVSFALGRSATGASRQPQSRELNGKRELKSRLTFLGGYLCVALNSLRVPAEVDGLRNTIRRIKGK